MRTWPARAAGSPPLGLRAAQHFATHIDHIVAGPIAHHTWTAPALRPWFDAQVTADRGNE
ncbi:hypothetical protein [Streptomyces sp. NPDC048248]|uniref:hypothetical protein n=1 Tax=Streptomyces sp. NPDC048248 TaxID=3365523 RepID=UPI003717C6C6